MKPLSIYIHIPFCKKKCFYCDFPSFAKSTSIQEKYVHALNCELLEKAPHVAHYTVTTIFFGGGTPTILSADSLHSIMETLFQAYSIDPNCEITIEANPGTLNPAFLKELKFMQFNRLSIGVQAWQNRLLQRLGRIHTIEEFLENYETARTVGFTNINVDLMFSLPTQTRKDWQETLQQMVSLEPEHISAYSLIVEPGTPFETLYATQRSLFPGEELDREMYALTSDILQTAGYHRYEISNFAKPNQECRHNTVYWKTKEYLGFGLGSHSYWNNYRYHNTYDLSTYLQSQSDFSKQIEEKEWLTSTEQYAEFMFMGLRMMEGISQKEFQSRFKKSIQEVYANEIQRLIQQGLLQQHGDFLQLTNRGIDISNYVFQQFV